MSKELQVAAVVGALLVVSSFAIKPANAPSPGPKQAVEVVKQQPKVTRPLPKPKPVVKKAKKKVAKAKPKKRETFCERVKREYDRMTWAERMTAYQRATPQQIAAGRRCLGM